jgi:hypothetical protein
MHLDSLLRMETTCIIIHFVRCIYLRYGIDFCLYRLEVFPRFWLHLNVYYPTGKVDLFAGFFLVFIKFDLTGVEMSLLA